MGKDTHPACGETQGNQLGSMSVPLSHQQPNTGTMVTSLLSLTPEAAPQGQGQGQCWHAVGAREMFVSGFKERHSQECGRCLP